MADFDFNQDFDEFYERIRKHYRNSHWEDRFAI